MSQIYEQLLADVEKVRKLAIVPTMLEVICRATGMGFSAVARVTEDRWIACSVLDEVEFGLKPGGELQLATTICNEIRQTGKSVVIDHVAEDKHFCNHHTPKMYGIQSYISVPIVLRSGEFFGTLCAIDPRPAQLNNRRITGMFELFAELIAFHLHNMDLMEQSMFTMHEMTRQLHNTQDENRQYQYIANHNLQEPLRKIRLFSNMLLEAMEAEEGHKVKELAGKIDNSAQKISMLINDLSDYTGLNITDPAFEMVDLNKVVADVCSHLYLSLETKKAKVNAGILPVIKAIPFQMEQLFYHLINNAIQFAGKDRPLVIQISSSELPPEEVLHFMPEKNNTRYFEIRIADNGIGIENEQLEKIFDIFSQAPYNNSLKGFGVGLAYCRKIIRNHGGSIHAASEPGEGAVFSIVLPVAK